MISSISGQIKAKAALMDPGHYGRSDTSAIGRWFWEIDKVLLLLIAVLIAIGLIAVAAASPAAAQRYSGGNVRFSELYYFYRQIALDRGRHPGHDRHLDDDAASARGGCRCSARRSSSSC